MLADVGCTVFGIDRDKRLVSDLRIGKPHFHEKGLSALLNKIQNNKEPPQYFISLGTSCADIYIITVGTPIIKNSFEPNLEYVANATSEVARVIKKGDMVILRSTIPVGTTRNLVLNTLQEISGLKVGDDFGLAFCPERTIEGKALKELRELPQIIGAYDELSAKRAKELFSRLTPTIIDLGNIESAEMLKIVDNTYRDMMFAYSNQVALLCNKLDINMSPIVQAANYGYNRNNIPVPSPGVGGACLSKDPYILAKVCKDVGISADFFLLGRKINNFMPEYTAKRTLEEVDKVNPLSKHKTVFVLGFAFKGNPETSDMRDSPTIDLVEHLQKKGARVFGHDPLVGKKELLSLKAEPTSIKEGISVSDAVIIMTNHSYYSDIDFVSIVGERDSPLVLFDGWTLFKPEDFKGNKNIRHLSI